MNEVSLVLKSVTILISTLKDAQRSSAAMGKLMHSGILYISPVNMDSQCTP